MHLLQEGLYEIRRVTIRTCPDAGGNDRVPDFVFLAHVVDVISSMHVPFVFRSVSSMPFTNSFFLLLLWPIAFSVMLLMWAFSKTFLLSFYNLRGRLHQTWVVPRYGFQVCSPSPFSPSSPSPPQRKLRSLGLPLVAVLLAVRQEGHQ